MTRSWTDPRTGKRWRIDVVHGARARPRTPGRGGAEATSALMFEGAEVSYALPTLDATRLEALEDDRLAELLDAAREGPPPQAGLKDAEGEEETAQGTRVRGQGPASPAAAGREAQPHRDPTTRYPQQ